MNPTPTAKQLSRIPPLYSSEDVPTQEKVIHAHFFVGGCDWWISEFDPKDGIFFGFCNLNDPQDAEWGYADFEELKQVRVQQKIKIGGAVMAFPVEVEFDRHWTPKMFKEIRFSR